MYQYKKIVLYIKIKTKLNYNYTICQFNVNKMTIPNKRN